MKILKFYADWCQPCKALSLIIAANPVSIPVQEVNLETEGDLAAQYRVKALPTLVMVGDDGEILRRHSGKMEASQWITFAQ